MRHSSGERDLDGRPKSYNQIASQYILVAVGEEKELVLELAETKGSCCDAIQWFDCHFQAGRSSVGHWQLVVCLKPKTASIEKKVAFTITHDSCYCEYMTPIALYHEQFWCDGRVYTNTQISSTRSSQLASYSSSQLVAIVQKNELALTLYYIFCTRIDI